MSEALIQQLRAELTVAAHAGRAPEHQFHSSTERVLSLDLPPLASRPERTPATAQCPAQNWLDASLWGFPPADATSGLWKWNHCQACIIANRARSTIGGVHQCRGTFLPSWRRMGQRRVPARRICWTTMRRAITGILSFVNLSSAKASTIP